MHSMVLAKYRVKKSDVFHQMDANFCIISIAAALTDILRKGQVLGGGKHSDTTARNGKVVGFNLDRNFHN